MWIVLIPSGIVAISHGCTGAAARACGLVGLEPTRVAEILKDRSSWFRNCRAVDDVNVGERSLSSTLGGPSMPPVQHFVGTDGDGRIIHIVHHMDFEPSSVPEVLRPLYESSTVIAQKTTMAVGQLPWRFLNQLSLVGVGGLQLYRHLLRRLADDVTILVNSSPGKVMEANNSVINGFSAASNAVLCVKASMLLQNVPAAVLLRFLREDLSEWAYCSINDYSASVVEAGPFSLPSLEVIKLEIVRQCPEDSIMAKYLFLLQLCNGMDKNAVPTCADLIIAPRSSSFADDAPLLPSGIRIIPPLLMILEPPATAATGVPSPHRNNAP
ncbi:hypothetical protein MKW92_015451 [Papaver armeniacum]|nr:hypothetical protein MKW92_015451 [Papaver armeniacum]